MSNLYSFGLIPTSSKVYLIIYRDGYYYSAYTSGINVIFKSLDPKISTPALFSYVITSTGITLSTNGLYLSKNGTTLSTSVSYHEFISTNYNLKPKTIYGGVYYIDNDINPILSSLVTNQSRPFGGATSTTIEGGFGTGIQFIPVEVPVEKDGFPTTYQYINGECRSPTTIDNILSDWMKGIGKGCTPGQLEQCVFTSGSLCETKYVAPYCPPGQNCGNCLGLCPTTSTLKECVYDYANTDIPYYDCDPTSPEPLSFWEKNKTIIIISIVVFVIVLLIIISIFVNIYQKITD